MFNEQIYLKVVVYTFSDCMLTLFNLFNFDFISVLELK